MLKVDDTDIKAQNPGVQRNNHLARSLGLIALGAVVGSVGTIAGLMQLAD